MSSREWNEWWEYYQEEPFTVCLIDSHFSNLCHLVVSMFVDAKDHDLTPADFSLLAMEEPQAKVTDDELMAVAESIPGGIRYVPVSG